MIELDYFQSSLSKPGDKGIFYLIMNKDDSMFEKDTYSFVCSGYSKMMYDKNEENIIYNNDAVIKKIPKKKYFLKLDKLKND